MSERNTVPTDIKRARASLQEAVARIGRRALTDGMLAALFNETAASVAEVLDVEFASVLELRDGGGPLEARAQIGWQDRRPGSGGMNAEADSHEVYALSCEEPVIVADFATELRFVPAPRLLENGIVSGIATMISGPSGRCGVLAVHCASARVFSGDDVHFLEAIANVLAGAIARARSLVHAGDQARLLDLAQDAIIVREYESRRIRFWNKGAERLYGWTVSEAVDERLCDLLLGGEGGQLEEINRELLAHGEWSGELRQLNKNGKPLIVHGRATLARDDAGQPRSVLIINTDLTEKKTIESQFLRAQRIEGIGALASGVAHDLNNILSPIVMCASLLRGEIPAAQRNELVSTIELAANRGAQIIRQVLAFGRGVEGEKRPLMLGLLVLELVQIAGETFPKNISVEATVEPALRLIIGDATQLHQVILNLCVNARDAMPAGGRLQIHASNIEIDSNYSSTLPEAKPGPHVLLEISDNGSGISHETLGRIFDPFFTTKALGKGTGLGLSTTLGIVRGHGGFITVTSEPVQGTVFKVYLPAVSGVEGIVASTVPAGIPSGHGEWVLVVDDEEPIRAALKKVLEDHGYLVLTATNGAEALAVFAKSPVPIRAVLTDIAMPVMDGVALIRALQKIAPTVPAIASTGQGDRAHLAELRSLRVHAVLNKPYGAEGVLRAVADVMLDPGLEK